MFDLDDETAVRLALIVSPEGVAAAGLELGDLTDADARAVAIRADHPELDEALADGRSEITVAGEPMNIRLHLAVHEIVANQLAANDPPEVYETAQRLLAAGYDRHEVLHMLARPDGRIDPRGARRAAALRRRRAHRRAQRAPSIVGARACQESARELQPTPRART